MVIELWARKIGQKGHVFLNVIEIPDGMRSWKVPVRQPLTAIKDNGPVDNMVVNQRIFEMQYSPLTGKIDDGARPRFLEI